MNLKITVLGVGHGDALLMQWEGPNLEETWTCLVDGGSSPERLHKHLQRLNVDSLNLVIGTHPDSDHLGGLVGLPNIIKNIDCYWAPPLPAFERHLWLFGKRCQESIRRCRLVEESFRVKNIDVQYPVEGYISAPFGTLGPRIHVLSPAAQLVRHMLTVDDASWLFASKIMPLGWLVEEIEDENVEQSAHIVALDRGLATGALRPVDLLGHFAREPQEVLKKNNFTSRSLKKKGIAPEFFGDSVLNNTSIVCWLEFPTGNKTHRILLPGDQENWTYLLAKNSRGLNADVLKAPHHGGGVFLEQEAGYEEVYSSVRPQVVVMSANGRYGLPHSLIRESVIRWGAAIMCTSERSQDTIVGPKNEVASCHVAMGCNKPSCNAVLTLDHLGIKSDRRLCHPGLGSLPGPVVRVHQHIVNPSAILDRLVEHELRRHISYVKRELRAFHERRQKHAVKMVEGSEPLKGAEFVSLTSKEYRPVLAAHLPTILSKAQERGEFWAQREHSYRDALWLLYTNPTDTEVKQYLVELKKKTMILFPNAIIKGYRDKNTLLTKLERHGLAALADAVLHFPVAMFYDAFWPEVINELKGVAWHCYIKGNDLAISQCSNENQLLSQLLKVHQVEQGAISYNFKEDFDPNLAPVLISGNGNKRTSVLPYEFWEYKSLIEEKWLHGSGKFKESQIERVW